MRFIRQSGRILEDKYVTEEIVAKWCQIELNSPPNEQAKKGGATRPACISNSRAILQTGRISSKTLMLL